MATIATGRIAMWEGGSLWLFDVPQTAHTPERNALHAHHALQLTFSIGGAFNRERLWRQPLALGRPGPVALVAANAAHAFEASGLVALLFADPESRTGRALAAKFLQGAPGSFDACRCYR